MCTHRLTHLGIDLTVFDYTVFAKTERIIEEVISFLVNLEIGKYSFKKDFEEAYNKSQLQNADELTVSHYIFRADDRISRKHFKGALNLLGYKKSTGLKGLYVIDDIRIRGEMSAKSEDIAVSILTHVASKYGVDLRIQNRKNSTPEESLRYKIRAQVYIYFCSLIRSFYMGMEDEMDPIPVKVEEKSARLVLASEAKRVLKIGDPNVSVIISEFKEAKKEYKTSYRNKWSEPGYVREFLLKNDMSVAALTNSRKLDIIKGFHKDVKQNIFATWVKELCDIRRTAKNRHYKRRERGKESSVEEEWIIKPLHTVIDDNCIDTLILGLE